MVRQPLHSPGQCLFPFPAARRWLGTAFLTGFRFYLLLLRHIQRCIIGADIFILPEQVCSQGTQVPAAGSKYRDVIFRFPPFPFSNIFLYIRGIVIVGKPYIDIFLGHADFDFQQTISPLPYSATFSDAVNSRLTESDRHMSCEMGYSFFFDKVTSLSSECSECPAGRVAKQGDIYCPKCLLYWVFPASGGEN